jgi:hypothetical protein
MPNNTLPEPTISQRPQARRITAEWTLFEKDGARHCAVLTITYHQGRCYSASLGNEEVKREGGFETRTFMVFGSVRVMTSDPVKRYSAKRQREFFDKALAYLIENIDDERFARYFETD